MASTIARPRVPRISTYTPNCATRPMTFAPVMFRVDWIASRTSTTIKIVTWLAGLKFQLNQLCMSAEKYTTTPVSTEATVTSSAIP